MGGRVTTSAGTVATSVNLGPLWVNDRWVLFKGVAGGESAARSGSVAGCGHRVIHP